ncbi:MAG: hypothetical protein FJX54_09010 [Alphaproteobacteria bacterium]|nr:hypothetical protein [Alphaproteobacteria bacterium]
MLERASHGSVAALIDAQRSRQAILSMFGDGEERAAAAAILTDLEQIGFVETRRGKIRWVGVEPFEVLRRLIALRDGPGRSLISLPKDDDCPITVYAVPDSAEGLPPHLKAWGGAAGTGFGRRAAAASCLFEVAERCSQMRADDEPVASASFSQLGESAIHPERLLLEGANHSGLDPKAAISWIAARQVCTGEKRWLPADYCFRAARREPSAWTCSANSNGCASGLSQDDVIVRGFFELVERDAVAIWWFNRLRRPSCSPEIVESDAIRTVTAWQHRRGRRCHLLDLTADLGVPVVAAVSCNVDGRGIAVGFGAHLDGHAAAVRASMEMMQFQAMIELSLRFRGLVQGQPSASTAAALDWFENVSINDDGYLLPDAEAQTVPTRAHSTPATPEHCLALAADHDLDVLYLDLSRDWIGIPAGRVVVPGLRSLEPHFGEGRLFDVPVALGWARVPRSVAEMNPRRIVF